MPIPKKGDLRLCDSWRGISLLDVVGKVFARILQERLLVITERESSQIRNVDFGGGEAFKKATAEFVSTAAKWGLTISLEKTKGLVLGKYLEPSDILPIIIAGGAIEVVRDFTYMYLGSIISDDGEVNVEVSTRIGKASRAFGCLQRSIFQNHHLTISTKREVYKVTVLSVLLYGTETWAIKAHSLKRMSGFHNRCIRIIMNITRYQQWKESITSKELASAFGLTETMAELLQRHRLRWLGHVARMNPCRLPKQLLFGELEKPRPRHGVKRRWRDLVLADIRAMGI